MTKRGKVVFTIVPNTKKRLKDMKPLFGILPSDATIGEDQKEREKYYIVATNIKNSHPIFKDQFKTN